MRLLALTIGLVLLAGCGKREDLAPRTGTSLPVKPATAQNQPNANDLMKMPPQANPDRVDNPLTKSVERPDDPFHLPPPG